MTAKTGVSARAGRPRRRRRSGVAVAGGSRPGRGIGRVGRTRSVAGAPADPPGNNGTIKIEGVDIQSGPPDNNPHQGCTFVVEFYNFDQGADLEAEVPFEDQAADRQRRPGGRVR